MGEQQRLQAMMNHAEEQEDGQLRARIDAAFDDSHAFGGVDDVDQTYQLAAGKRLIDFNDVVDMEVVGFHLDDSYVQNKWRNEHLRAAGSWFVSNILILLIVIVLCFVGGYMFNSLEDYNNQQNCVATYKQYTNDMNVALIAIQATANNFQLSYSQRQSQFSSTLNTLISAFVNSTWDGEDCDNMLPKWELASATYFCLTIATTIGYGYIAPKTDWGHATVIGYALILIPMMLAALGALGGFFSEIAKYNYHALCCCGICRKVKEEAYSHKQVKSKMAKKWRRELGDEVKKARTKAKRELVELKNEKMELFIDALEESTDSDDADSDADLGGNTPGHHESKPVPMSIALAIMSSILIFGASIFTVTEGWSFADAVYFSFISMATIGFGDLVPGAVGTNTAIYVDWKFGLLAFFNIFSIAMLAMCLNLIQQNIASDVRGLAKHFTHRKKKKRVSSSSSSSSSSSDDDDDDENEENFDELDEMKRQTQQHANNKLQTNNLDQHHAIISDEFEAAGQGGGSNAVVSPVRRPPREDM